MATEPLEFNDCVIDGPYFRLSLSEHEKEIANACRGVKAVYNSLKLVFDAMQQLSTAFREFATSLREYPIQDTSTKGSGGEDSGETDDEKVIRSSLETYAQMIESIEDMRCELMMGPAKDLVMSEIEKLKNKWLAGTKEDTKKFSKETAIYCQKLEKYLSYKWKTSDSILREVDTNLQMDRRNFIKCSLDHVLCMQKSQEKTQYKFVGSISLLIQMASTFHHQAWEHFVDCKRRMDDINAATQRTRESYKAIHESTRNLRDKLLDTPPERVKSSDSNVTREGYLFMMTRKAMATNWVKVFCSYQKDSKLFTRIPYVQTNIPKMQMPEKYRLRSCVRRPQDSIDRRFCFDVEVEDRNNPLTLQALSADDMRMWLTAMDGTEPVFQDTNVAKFEVGRTLLNSSGFHFVRRCLEEIERRGLEEEGLYRMGGAKQKLDKFIHQGLDENAIGRMRLDSTEDYDTKTLTSAVKHYIRHLSEPLMTFQLNDKFIAASKLKEPDKRVKEVGELLKQMPSDHFNQLCLLIQHLHKVVQKSDRNLMTAPNLGVVFGPTVFRPAHESVAAIMEIRFAGVVVEILIEHCPRFFPRAPVPPAASSASAVASSTAPGTPRPEETVRPSGNGLMERLTHLRSSRFRKSSKEHKTTTFAPGTPGTMTPASGDNLSITTENMNMKGSHPDSPVMERRPPRAILNRAPSLQSGISVASSRSGRPQVAFSTPPEVPASAHAPPRPKPPPSALKETRTNTPVAPRSALRQQAPTIKEGARLSGPPNYSDNMSAQNSPLFLRQDYNRRSLASHPSRPVGSSPCFIWKGRYGRARTLYRCIGESERELSFEPNKIISNVRSSNEAGWLVGEMDGREGLIPQNYVELLT